jgi:hypothetical protein
LELSNIPCAVQDLEASVNSWCEWFDLDKEEMYFDQELKAHCQKVTLKGGDILFCSPSTDPTQEQKMV